MSESMRVNAYANDDININAKLGCVPVQINMRHGQSNDANSSRSSSARYNSSKWFIRPESTSSDTDRHNSRVPATGPRIVVACVGCCGRVGRGCAAIKRFSFETYFMSFKFLGLRGTGTIYSQRQVGELLLMGLSQSFVSWRKIAISSLKTFGADGGRLIMRPSL